MRRVAILSSASGCGTTTLGRELARRPDVPFHELDAPHHGPAWTGATAEELSPYRVVRLRSPKEEERWLATFG